MGRWGLPAEHQQRTATTVRLIWFVLPLWPVVCFTWYMVLFRVFQYCMPHVLLRRDHRSTLRGVYHWCMICLGAAQPPPSFSLCLFPFFLFLFGALLGLLGGCGGDGGGMDTTDARHGTQGTVRTAILLCQWYLHSKRNFGAAPPPVG